MNEKETTMTDTYPLPEDPRGRRRALGDAVAALRRGTPTARAAAWSLLALGRCLLAEVTPPEGAAEAVAAVWPVAEAKILGELASWARSAETLRDRWHEADGDEADALVEALVELRTDAWAIEAALDALGVRAPHVNDAVAAFDDALRARRDVVATLAGFNWLENYRSGWRDEGAEQWWLGGLDAIARLTDEEAARTLPPADYWGRVRTAGAWKRSFPPLVEAGAMAAQTRPDEPTPLPRRVRWTSPDGRYLAELLLPAFASADDDGVARPLWLTRADGEAAPELVGRRLRLGGIERSVTDGRVTLTLRELRANCDGRLLVGDPAEEWPLEQERNP